jgi:RHS repeat-associated protein
MTTVKCCDTLAAAGDGATNYGFTNEYTSQGLIYLRARFYSPSQGRFLTKDTWEGDYTMPMSYNGWLYGYANPVNSVDPSGFGPDEGCSILDRDCVELSGNERDLTSWLYRELKANASSTYALKMYSFITSLDPVKWVKGYQAFYNLVQNEAKWDFKHKIQLELESKSFVLFHGIKRDDFRWYEFSVAGNINFGYVGRASGIPGEILHVGAGRAEIKDPAHYKRGEALCYLDCLSFLCGSYYINPGWSKSLYDDPQDYEGVKLGIKMFDMYGRFMTYENFQNALNTYGYLMTLSSEYHGWGWKNSIGKWPYEVGHFNGPSESKFEPLIQSLLFNG